MISIFIVTLLTATAVSITGIANENESNQSQLQSTLKQTCTIGDDDIIDQKQTDFCNWGWSIYGLHSYYAQSFVPTLESLSKVELILWRKGSPETLTISILDDLNGDELTSVSISYDMVQESSKWITFDFPDIETIPGQTYYIRWSCD